MWRIVEVADFKNFRKVNGLKQEEIADFLGVSKAFLSQVENSKRALPPAQLSKLLDNPYNWDTRMLLIDDQTNNANRGAIQIQQNGLQNKIGKVLSQQDSEKEIALRKENEILRQRIDDLKAENDKLWKMIEKLTGK